MAKKAHDYLSKGQIAGAVSTADMLLAGKQNSAKQSFQSGVQAQPNFGNQGGAQGGGQPQTGAPAQKTLSSVQIQQAAKDHGVSVDEATRQAKAAGYQIK